LTKTLSRHYVIDMLRPVARQLIPYYEIASLFTSHGLWPSVSRPYLTSAVYSKVSVIPESLLRSPQRSFVN